MPSLAVGLIFILVPVLELVLLIKIGQWVGVLPTLALVGTTAVTGALIISQQSFTVLRQTLEAMGEGRPPLAPVLNGLFLILAGALLLTPGLITDVAALLLLVPPIRRVIARRSVERLLRTATVRVHEYGDGPASASDTPRRPPAGTADGPVIEGEFERLDETPTGSQRDDGSRPQ